MSLVLLFLFSSHVFKILSKHHSGGVEVSLLEHQIVIVSIAYTRHIIITLFGKTVNSNILTNCTTVQGIRTKVATAALSALSSVPELDNASLCS